jgi:hypothetical protein
MVTVPAWSGVFLVTAPLVSSDPNADITESRKKGVHFGEVAYNFVGIFTSFQINT